MSDIKEEIKEYLSKHKIRELFGHLSTLLFYNRPEDPIDFLANALLDVKEALRAGEPLATLFTEESLKAYFRLLDPVGEGSISEDQMKSAMAVLGVGSDEKVGKDGVDEMFFVRFLTDNIQKNLPE